MSDEEELVPGGRRGVEDGPGLVTAFTLVVWIGCVAVGATGLLSQPASLPAPPTSQPAVQVVSVELEAAPPSPGPAAASVAPPTPPAVPMPQLPSVPAAALPSPAIAFAVPVAGAVRIRGAAEAMPVVSAVRRLSAEGSGGGGDHRPTLHYPADTPPGLSGNVVVRFMVDGDGRVARAWVVTACRWPQLNQQAVHDAYATREPPGPPHIDEYEATFKVIGGIDE
jgi:TonB family protein